MSKQNKAARSGNPAKRAAAPIKTAPKDYVEPKVNGRFFVPIMVTLLILGVLVIVLYYVAPTLLFPSLGAWKIAVGMVLLLAGTSMATRWH